MTRKQAEKIAYAIRVAAEQQGGREWTSQSITTSEVAALLKKRPEDVEEAIRVSASAIWGCMPLGWSFRVRGATGIEVYRPGREG